MLNAFRPKAGRFGTASVVVDSGPIGGANFLGGATAITASSTTTFRLPTPPVKARFVSVATSTVTVPVSSGGTMLAVVNKYTGSAVAQTGNIDLIALTTRQITVTKGTAAEKDRIFNGTTDVLEIVVTSNAAIGTQPAGLIFTVLFEILA